MNTIGKIRAQFTRIGAKGVYVAPEPPGYWRIYDDEDGLSIDERLSQDLLADLKAIPDGHGNDALWYALAGYLSPCCGSPVTPSDKTPERVCDSCGSSV